MDPLSMEKAMIKNMTNKTGKSIEEWIALVRKQDFAQNKECIKFLKEQHSLGHFYAHLIARKSK